ncbi:MAG: hypothetical protein IPI29_06435 [Ignavibacteria bacterium]|nr:hypothetical protein [Ignavibacteria bacterium]
MSSCLLGQRRVLTFPEQLQQSETTEVSVQVMSISGGLVRTTMVEGTAEVRPIDAQKGPSGSDRWWSDNLPARTRDLRLVIASDIRIL